MRRFLVVAFAALLIAALSVPVFAWEFSMTGQWENRLRYFGRTGPTDLFGVAPLQDDPAANWPASGGARALNQDCFVGFAGPNIYGQGWASPIWMIRMVVDEYRAGSEPQFGDNSGQAGVRITRGGYSWTGSDALYTDTALTFKPVITVNRAIRILQVVRLGGVRHKYAQYDFQSRPGFGETNFWVGTAGRGTVLTPTAGVPPFERYYMSQSSMNAVDTAAIYSVEQFRAVIQTPWTIFSLGVKPFPFGTGANLGYNTRAEAFLAVTPYGPFRLLYAIWLGRSRFAESWGTTPGGDLKNDFFQGLAITYDNGPLSMGAISFLRNYHGTQFWRNMASGFDAAGIWSYRNLLNAGATEGDDNTWVTVAYMKYNNGRFFANAEYSWANVDRYYPAGALAALGVGELHVEAYNVFTEAGFTVGPAKFSAMWAQSSGQVLNNRNFLNAIVHGGSTSGIIGTNNKVYGALTIN